MDVSIPFRPACARKGGCLDTPGGVAPASGGSVPARSQRRPPPTKFGGRTMPNDLHNVLMRLGLSNSAAGTVEVLIRPAAILLTVVLAVVVSRTAARATRRFVFSLVSRTQAPARSDRAPSRATALASSAAGLAP